MQSTYRRDRIFWLVSLQTGIYGFFMGGFGPALPLLQADQGTSGAVAGLHGTALGFASIVAGILNSRIVHRFGRYRAAWVGIAMFLFGAFFFVSLQSAYQTIIAIFFVGIGISVAIANTVTYLTGHYGEQAPRAVAQNNAVTSGFNLIGTIIIGLIATAGASWRFGLLACFPFAVILYLTMGRRHAPEHIPSTDGRQRGPLPRNFWWSWLGLVFTISTEFAIAFWSGSLIKERTGLSAALSTTMVLAFPLGMFLGRWFGTSIRPELSIDGRLRAILTLQLIGFVALWNSYHPVLSFIGLLMAGLGTSLQFTLTSLRLISFSSGKTDLAMGYNSLAAGIAISASPFLLGALADQLGITRAFLIVPIYIVIAYSVIRAIPMREASR